MSARSASSAVLTHVGGGGAVRRHAHVERAVALEREAALGVVELHRRDADVEHDAVDGRKSCSPRPRGQLAEAAFDQGQPAAARHRPEAGRQQWPLGSRSMASTRTSGAASRRARRIAAGAEGAVNEGARPSAAPGRQHLGKQHGNVAPRPSAAPRPMGCRCAPSFPCSSLAALLVEDDGSPRRTACGGLAPSRGRAARRASKRAGSHIWNFSSEADEGDVGR